MSEKLIITSSFFTSIKEMAESCDPLQLIKAAQIWRDITEIERMKQSELLSDARVIRIEDFKDGKVKKIYFNSGSSHLLILWCATGDAEYLVAENIIEPLQETG